MTPRSASILVVLVTAAIFLVSGFGINAKRSPPQAYLPWTLAVIGDTQTHPRVMQWAMQGIKRRGITYGLHLGDIHHCGNFKMWRWKKRLLSKSGARWLLTMGNHARWPCRGRWRSWSVVRKSWTTLWHKNLGDTMRIHDVRGWRFIALDTASNVIPKGHVSRLQLALQTATGPVVLTGHRPLPVPFKVRSTKVRNGKRWVYYAKMGPLPYKHLRNRALWKTVVKYRNRIAAIFTGHWHAYGTYKLAGIPAYVSGGGGGPLQRRGGFYHWLSIRITGMKKTDYQIKIIKWGTP